ncbi:molybdenum cofactor biosynthesis protein MoaE [Rhodobacterales bacterium 52_120_T64]|nr:molybdenum cofactor biosynthesis protein MoaE [Rhodobacterales bacterium 52_120_T64]
MSVSVQAADFDVGAEIKALANGRTDIGAVVTFTGLVRDMAGGEKIADMELEHYPGMTEKALANIEAEANERWHLQATRIVHRFGKLTPGAQIVLVATASPHRGDAFEAAEFIMDFLKSRAPFWKKEGTPDGGRWVDARDADEDALNRWS